MSIKPLYCSFLLRSIRAAAISGVLSLCWIAHADRIDYVIAPHPALADLPSQNTVTFKTLDYAIRPSLFQEMCDLADLTDHARAVAEEAYNFYWPRAVSLDRQATRATEDAGQDEMRELFSELIAVKLDAPPDARGPTDEQLRRESKVAQLRYEIKVAKWRYLKDADHLLEDLFQACVDEEVFSHDVRVRLERFLRRRQILPSASSGNGDFLLTVDLLPLVGEAQADRGALYKAMLDPHLRSTINDALMRYELSLDGFLRRHPLARRSRPEHLKTVYRPSDDEFHKRRERAAQKAMRLWSIQRSLIEGVFNILNAAHPEAAREWRWAAQSKINPGLYKHFVSLDLFAMCSERLALTPDQRTQLEHFRADFHRRHQDLCDAAFRSGIRAECDQFARFGGAATDRLNLKHAEDQLAIHKNGRQYITRVLATLDSMQRGEVLLWLMPSPGASLWLGPIIHPVSVAALGRKDQYNNIRNGAFLE